MHCWRNITLMHKYHTTALITSPRLQWTVHSKELLASSNKFNRALSPFTYTEWTTLEYKHGNKKAGILYCRGLWWGLYPKIHQSISNSGKGSKRHQEFTLHLAPVHPLPRCQRMLKALLGQPGEQHQRHSSRAHTGCHQTQPSPPRQSFSTAKESSILCAGRQRLHQVPGMINMEFVISLTISSWSNKRAAVWLTDSNSEKKNKEKTD